MAPQPVSSEASFNRDTRLSRRTSAHSAHSNVFSDDHAYSDGDVTPVDSIQESVDFSLPSRDHNTPLFTTNIPRSALPQSFTSGDRPPSTLKRSVPSGSISHPHRALSVVTDSDAASHRTFSTSSRFSMPRSQSPYNGPTAPSQPYAMYPQVTRASSIASDSTLRPPERPFVNQGGPEHPYGMYQNTVPEEDDDDEHSHSLPLRFPAIGSSFRDGSSSSGNDTGDIVGSDGHVEQLPPYSRYADNVIAKGDMATIDPPTISNPDESTSAQSDPAASDSALELNRPRGEQMEEEQVARKEGWLAKSKRRRCCGMPLWAVMVMCLVVFAAAAMGGIIGGVIGNEKGADRALGSSAATTTVWLDADPVATGPGTPPCPTGHYTIPFNNTQQIGSCVVDQQDLGMTWDCMNSAYLGISLFDHGPAQPYTIAFDDYSVRPQAFQYGPQPPDFNGSVFDLQPVKDKDDTGLGVGMFFSHLFDKLIILPSDALAPPPPGPGKRSVPARQITRRDYNPPTGRSLAVGDKPWYCFWNSTIEEFWVFLEQDLNTSSTSSSTAVPTPSPSAPQPYSSHSSTSTVPTHSMGYTKTPSGSQTNAAAAATNTWPGSRAKRSSPYSDPNAVNTFPRLIKMVEKRKPHSNIQPYCQQMQVLNDWQIMPIPLVPTICIEESEFAQPTGSSSKRWTPRKRGADDPIVELESECICEWFNAPGYSQD